MFTIRCDSKFSAMHLQLDVRYNVKRNERCDIDSAINSYDFKSLLVSQVRRMPKKSSHDITRVAILSTLTRIEIATSRLMLCFICSNFSLDFMHMTMNTQCVGIVSCSIFTSAAL